MDRNMSDWSLQPDWWAAEDFGDDQELSAQIVENPIDSDTPNDVPSLNWADGSELVMDQALQPLFGKPKTFRCDKKAIEPEEAQNFCNSYRCMLSSTVLLYDAISRNAPERLYYRPSGIHNPSTSCYMISCVQGLGCIPSFAVNFVLSNPIAAKNTNVLGALFRTFKYYWTKSSCSADATDFNLLNPAPICRYYRNNFSEEFPDDDHHDAEEFMGHLIDQLEKETEELGLGVGDENPVTQLFRGYVEESNGARDPFYVLRLGIEGIAKVEDALLKYLGARPKVDQNLVNEDPQSPSLGNNLWVNGEEMPIQKKIHAPEILCLTLVRQTIESNTIKYNKAEVSVCDMLMIPSEHLVGDRPKPEVYKLKAEIRYTKFDAIHGHYFVRVCAGADGGYILNDEKVRTYEKVWPEYQDGHSSTLIYVKFPKKQ